MNKEKIKEIFNKQKLKVNKIKEIIKSKEGITLVGIITILLVITLISVAVKDTHAYYNSVTDPVQIFNSKVGNFKPRIETFYIKDNNLQLKYTNQIENTVYITLGNNNKNLNQVCITETDDISTCDNKWQDIKSDNQYNYTFANTNEEGEKIIFGFVKDRYENKSESIRDTITYDVTPPTIEYSLPENTYTGDQTLTVTPKDTLSGIDTWSVHVYKGEPGDYSNKEETKSADYTSSQLSHTITLEEGTWTIYTNIYDKAGNRHVTQRPERAGWYYQTYTIKKSGKSGQDLIDDRTNIPNLQDTAVNGLYRYYGNYDVVNNNYICLGPSGNTCQSEDDKNNYLYRIIGIADGTEKNTLDIDAGSIKVIKAISIGQNQWHSNYETDTDWDGADLQRNLNSTLFYNDTTKLDTRIQSMIKDVKWYKGTITGSSNNPPKAEPTDKISDVHPIGLMYASDYYNSWEAYNGNGNLESWLNITHGASTSSSSAVTEWTMTRYGLIGGIYRAWNVYNDGSLRYNYGVTVTHAVRPVFYLVPNIKLAGTGIITDPYIPN